MTHTTRTNLKTWSWDTSLLSFDATKYCGRKRDTRQRTVQIEQTDDDGKTTRWFKTFRGKTSSNADNLADGYVMQVKINSLEADAIMLEFKREVIEEILKEGRLSEVDYA